MSGKGLQAALTMSLILGFWQKLTGASPSPQSVLTELNSLLQARLQNGFVTCLCARIQPDGVTTIANAGHLAPYLNGREISLQNALPLGVAAEIQYEQTICHLSAHDSLVFITDGIVEARDGSGSFFGFDRLEAALAQQLSPAAIARQACQFGQTDDITVIGLRSQQLNLVLTPDAHSATAFA